VAPGAEAAERVHEHFDFEAGAGAGGEVGHDLLRGFVVAKDEGLEVDGFFGAGDFVAQGAVGDDAIGKDLEGIMREFAAEGNGRGGAPGGRGGGGEAGGELDGEGVDFEFGLDEAADFAAAEKQIKRNAEPGDEEDDEAPGEDVAGGAALEHEARADEEGEQETEEDAQMLPEEIQDDLPHVAGQVRRLGQQGGRNTGEDGEHGGIMN